MVEPWAANSCADPGLKAHSGECYEVSTVNPAFCILNNSLYQQLLSGGTLTKLMWPLPVALLPEALNTGPPESPCRQTTPAAVRLAHTLSAHDPAEHCVTIVA